ncbi:hypothetical protein KXR87_09515 [Yokenella regensburgei]|uniref:hypothetical protein n=1 Tax=Yokenella regensburgei TaxID=158877 RepID=UPI003F15A87F
MIPNIDITMPRAPASGYTLVFNVDGSKIGNGVKAGCNKAIQLRYSLLDAGAALITGYNYSGQINDIYPTSSDGMGMSFNEATTGGKMRFQAWPSSHYMQTILAATPGYLSTFPILVHMRLWSTPDFIHPGGPVTYTGPTFVAFITPAGGGDTISDCPAGSERMPGDNDKTCVIFKRQVVISARLRLGTCDLDQQNKIVYLGSHDGSAGQHSPWKDASFKLSCPPGYGYGAMHSGATGPYDLSGGYQSFAGLRNKPVTLQINPLNPPIATVPGTMELDAIPGSASGYGIQLAWGESTSQSEPPLKPVNFSARVKASELNSNFYQADYTGRLPGNRALPVGADSTIRLSARYVRLPATPLLAGKANGKVEILASYE